MASGQGYTAPARPPLARGKIPSLFLHERKKLKNRLVACRGSLIFVLFVALTAFILLGTRSRKPRELRVLREPQGCHVRAKVRRLTSLAGGFKTRIGNVHVEMSDDSDGFNTYQALMNITVPPTPGPGGSIPVPSPEVPPQAEKGGGGEARDGEHVFGRADDEEELKAVYKSPAVAGDETFTKEEKEALMRDLTLVDHTTYRTSEETIKLAEKAEALRELNEEKEEAEALRIDPASLNDTNPDLPADPDNGYPEILGAPSELHLEQQQQQQQQTQQQLGDAMGESYSTLGISTPDVSTTGIPSPGISTPGISTPGISAACAETPGVSTPGVATPGMSTPGIPRGASTPGLSTPGVPEAGGAAPGVETPGVSTPGSGYSSDYFGDMEHSLHDHDDQIRDNTNAGHTPFPGHTPLQGHTAAASPHPELENDATAGIPEGTGDIDEPLNVSDPYPAVPAPHTPEAEGSGEGPKYRKPDHLAEMAAKLGIIDEDEGEDFGFPEDKDDSDDRLRSKDDAPPLPPPDSFADPPSYNQDPLIAFFEPGPLGITFNAEGKVVEVKKDSQAKQRGVVPGMRIFRIKTTFIPLNASRNSIVGLLMTCIRGDKRYPITFLAPPLTDQASTPPSFLNTTTLAASSGPPPPPPDEPAGPPRSPSGVAEWVLLGAERIRPSFFWGGVSHVAYLYADKSTIPANYTFNRSDTEVLSKCPIRFALLFNRTKQAGDQKPLQRMINGHLENIIEEAQHPRRWLSNSLSNAVKNQPLLPRPRRSCLSLCSPIDEAECGPEIRIEIYNQTVAIMCGGNQYGALHNPVLSLGLLEMVLGRGTQCIFVIIRSSAVRKLMGSAPMCPPNG